MTNVCSGLCQGISEESNDWKIIKNTLRVFRFIEIHLQEIDCVRVLKDSRRHLRLKCFQSGRHWQRDSSKELVLIEYLKMSENRKII